MTKIYIICLNKKWIMGKSTIAECRRYIISHIKKDGKEYGMIYSTTPELAKEIIEMQNIPRHVRFRQYTKHLESISWYDRYRGEQFNAFRCGIVGGASDDRYVYSVKPDGTLKKIKVQSKLTHLNVNQYYASIDQTYDKQGKEYINVNIGDKYDFLFTGDGKNLLSMDDYHTGEVARFRSKEDLEWVKNGEWYGKTYHDYALPALKVFLTKRGKM